MTPRLRPHYAWAVLAMCTLIVFGALGMARFGYTALLPTMQNALGLGNTEAGMIATANMVGYLAFSAVGGVLAARFGGRNVSSAGLALAGLGMICTGLARGFVPLLFWRAVTGLGSGAANVTVMGMLPAWFTPHRRGLASGVAVAGSSLALILIGPLVPRMLLALGESAWQACWFLFGALSLLVAGVSWLVLRDRPSDLGLLPLGTRSSADVPTASSTSAKPRIRDVYRSAPVWHLGLVYVAFGFSYIIYMTFFTKRLVADAGYTSEAAGGLYMTIGWFSLVCGLLWGGISDAIGRKWALMGVYLVHSVAFGLFAYWPTRAGFTLSAVLFGLSAWSIPAIVSAACGDILEPALVPAGVGFVTLFFGIGQAFSPTIAGLVADASGSLTGAYAMAAGVALLGAVGTMWLRPYRNSTANRL